MQLGMIGLGRMGSSMVRRLMKAGHECVVYDIHPASEPTLEKEGAIGSASLEEFVKKLTLPRVIWLMVPAAAVDEELIKLIPLLKADDIIVDGGNSHYVDDLRRAAKLKAEGIHHVDVGASDGVWGLEQGFCLMIGGEDRIVKHLDPIFVALAPGVVAAPPTPGRDKVKGTADQGYLHCGPNGAGHFVKMVHNGIEYGLMAAYAEGLNVLRNADIGKRPAITNAETTPLQHPEEYQYELNVPDIAEVWRRGTIIRSFLLDLIAIPLLKNPDLDDYSGRVSDSGEGRWTIAAAIDEAVPTPVLSAALYERFASRGDADFADKLLSAMRFEFGGHLEKSDAHQSAAAR